jgi:tetratricopeptide (TPR) repeat protein
MYQSALEQDSAYAKAYTGLWLVYTTDQDNYSSDSALVLINKALSYDDQEEVAYYALGAIYYISLNDPEQAMNYFDKALEINPNYELCYMMKGGIYNDSYGDMVNTIKNYHKALQLNEEVYFTPRILGYLRANYLRAGFYEQAEFYASEQLKLNENTSLYMRILADIELARGNYNESIDLYQQAYDNDSSNYWLYNIIMQRLYTEGREQEALNHALVLDSLVNHENLDANGYYHRIGFMLWHSGEKEKAQWYLDKKIEESLERIRNEDWDPGKWTYYNLAGVYAFLGDKEKAYEYLEEYNTKKFEGAGAIQYFRLDPLFNSIREEERFQQILYDLQAKYQREHDKLKVWMEEEGII